ncbi:hypothetical protein FSP39_019379 [Pinctada imbricata]|uniref:PH domain-containing protein n=1 Tax=Pinctada imbricata TaxID=66713 RepID=A0AA88XG03_PINIB|nr:hypothetical protein FSP39_019379 [Pinctada imbricata]
MSEDFLILTRGGQCEREVGGRGREERERGEGGGREGEKKREGEKGGRRRKERDLYESTGSTIKMLGKLKHKGQGHGHKINNGGPETSHHSIFRSHSELRKSIWYAFSTLAVSHDATAAVSTLKVLTSTLGRPLGFETAEEILEEENAHDSLDFQMYYDILERKIFDRIDKSSEETLKLVHPNFEEIHKVSWALYFNAFIKGSDQSNHLPEDFVRKLWTIFNLLADDDENGIPLIPPRTDREEIAVLLRAFTLASGQADCESQICIFEQEEGTMDFLEFKTFFLNTFAPNFRFQLLLSTLETIYEEFIGDILEKGMLFKRGHQVKNWKERWMVLKPDGLRYFTGENEKDLKGCIQLHTACTVEVVTEKASGNKPNRFILSTNMKPYEMSAADIKTRNDWIKALQLAIDNADNPSFHYHKLQSKERQRKRKAKRKVKEAEEARRKQDEETIRKLRQEYDEKVKEDDLRLQEHLRELEAEKLAREELEARLLKEAALREVEQRRLRELQEIKRQLEKLLEEERQAKKDEEIVRALQARLYEEECEKREELERLKREQDELLLQERQEKEGLEEMKIRQEGLLQQARDKLSLLETEREAANTKLEEASSKLLLAEKERSIMEAKVKLWKTPIGLARPVEPKVDPRVTHRGRGAFCEDDFKKSPEWCKDKFNQKEVENGDEGRVIENKDKQAKQDGDSEKSEKQAEEYGDGDGGKENENSQTDDGSQKRNNHDIEIENVSDEKENIDNGKNDNQIENGESINNEKQNRQQKQGDYEVMELRIVE